MYETKRNVLPVAISVRNVVGTIIFLWSAEEARCCMTGQVFIRICIMSMILTKSSLEEYTIDVI